MSKTLDDLEKIQELKTKGILTQEEFENEKYKILNTANDNCDNELSEKDKSCNPSIKKIIIYVAIFIIIVVIIGGILIIKNKGNSTDISNNETTKEQKEQQVQDKSIDIKLYDVNNEKPSIIKLDNTSETGAIYDFTKEDFELVIKTVCTQNNIKYEINPKNNENSYGYNINLNDNITSEIILSLKNDKINGLSFARFLLDENPTSELENKIFTEIIEELFEEDYASQIIKANNEILSDEYRYVNNSLFYKGDLTSALLLALKNDENIDQKMEEWELINQQLDMNLSIFMIIPSTEEYYKTFQEDLYNIEDKLKFMENKVGTTFKDINSISYVKFTSDTDFEMMIGVEGSEAFTKTGTYNKNGNTVALNVSYDSELESSEYNGITEPFSPYEIQMNIKDENTLQYIDKYNTTYIFKKE